VSPKIFLFIQQFLQFLIITLQYLLNLETAVEREKAVQEIYVHREFLKLVVTLWVIRDFKSFLGA